MFTKMDKRLKYGLVLGVILVMVVATGALAAVWTDKPDYSPGEVVTISGDNSDGEYQGYWEAGETVLVIVNRPDGSTISCEGVADDDGAWLCKITLQSGSEAVGDYTYIAYGQNSGVSQSGTFSDGNLKAKAAPAGVTFTLIVTRYNTSDCSGSGSTSSPYGTFSAVNNDEGKTFGLNQDDRSLKFQAAETSNQDSAFTEWTSSYPFTDLGSRAICVQGFQGDGSREYFANYSTGNAAPSVDAGGPYPGSEGSPVNLDGTVIDPDGDPVSTTWTYAIFSANLGTTCSFDDASADDTTITCTDDGTFTVTLTAYDGINDPVSDSATLTLSNVDPTANAGLDQSGDEGSLISFSFSCSDPGTTDTWTASVDWGDGSSVESLGAVTCDSGTFGAPHTYADNGTYTVTLTVVDDDGGSGSDTAIVTVSNVAPSVGSMSLSANSIYENDSVTLTSSCTDPGTADTWTATVDWDDGSTVQDLGSVTCNNSPIVVTHQYLDDNPTGTPSDVNTITLTVTDDDEGSGNASTNITVNNLAPEITGVSANPIVIAVNTSTTVTATFTDVGTQDTHTCTFDWGDSSQDTTVQAGSGNCFDSHIYPAAGVYRVGVTVTDDDTGSDSMDYEFVVVYDPSAGFVTGGGWIYSTADACPVVCGGAVGKANFGFNSQYKKGANEPTGQTQFQFSAGGLNFHSTSYEWLVVTGSNQAKYKGSGTINGAGDYGFMLTAVDSPSGDTFRIKIWDKSTGDVVYDNQMGAADDSYDGTLIGGGSIVIHTGKK